MNFSTYSFRMVCRYREKLENVLAVLTQQHTKLVDLMSMEVGNMNMNMNSLTNTSLVLLMVDISYCYLFGIFIRRNCYLGICLPMYLLLTGLKLLWIVPA